MLVVPASAGSDPSLLDRLNAAEPATRRAASAEILAEDGPAEAELAAALAAATDRPEARARLVSALRHRFLGGYREGLAGVAPAPPGDAGMLERVGRAALQGVEAGSLGVTHRAFPAGGLPGVEEPAIGVVRTLPGFPAYAALRAGDLIVGLNGRPLPWPDPVPEPADRRRPEAARARLAATTAAAGEAFSQAVQKAGAGSRITLRVLRDGESLEIPVTLASSTALQRLYARGGFDPAAERAWQERLAGLLPPAAEP